MPRIVPSQVVSFIDRFPLPERNNVVQLSDLEPYVLSSTLALIDQIPDELLTMDGATYASLVEQKYRVKDILERWRTDADQGHQRYTHRVLPADSPLAIIRGALAKCPDESPAPSTSQFNGLHEIAFGIVLNDFGSDGNLEEGFVIRVVSPNFTRIAVYQERLASGRINNEARMRGRARLGLAVVFVGFGCFRTQYKAEPTPTRERTSWRASYYRLG
jgi:hypothetical protein